jgi:hypothetical protein
MQEIAHFYSESRHLQLIDEKICLLHKFPSDDNISKDSVVEVVTSSQLLSVF